MPSPDEVRLTAAVTAYRTATSLLRTQLKTFVQHLWGSLGSYHDEQAARFLAGLLPVLQGSEQHMADLTTAFLTQMRDIAIGGGSPLTVPRGDVTGAATRNGTDPSKVYMRPFEQVWTDWSKGVDPQKAVDRGLVRAENLVQTDLQRTKTLTSQAAMSQETGIFGYRRVLEGAHSCGLCVVASTRRYHKAELLPIHPGCDCDVAPIFGTKDPGEVLNKGLLKDVHAAVADFFGDSAAANSAADGYQDLIITHEHGELGPVLGQRGQHFEGPRH